MAHKYVIHAYDNPQFFSSVQFKDGADTYSCDFSPWAEDNNSITTATWTVKAGNVTLSNESLSSNVASALFTFSEAGRNHVELKADSGTEIYIVHLIILARNPYYPVWDYGYTWIA